SLYQGWQSPQTQVSDKRRHDNTFLDRGADRTNPPTAAENRQRQENAVSETRTAKEAAKEEVKTVISGPLSVLEHRARP
ncbi:MAG TPA: hypothetical protein VI685_15405, partial [Candidatus Angelobacter sp.]